MPTVLQLRLHHRARLAAGAGLDDQPARPRLGLVVPARIGPVDKVELELPGTAHHELLVYRVVPNSPVAKGERLPRWARPSLVVRDGQSMRYQYAGRLSAGDYVYLFISARYPHLLDRLFASPAPVEGDDTEFFGAFTIDPSRPARDLEAAYGPALADEESDDMTIADLMKKRLGGRAEYRRSGRHRAGRTHRARRRR
jgi:potassium/hydrogen antiporter